MVQKHKTFEKTELFNIDQDELEQDESTVYVDKLSADGRRVSRVQHVFYTPPSPVRNREPRRTQSILNQSKDDFLPWEQLTLQEDPGPDEPTADEPGHSRKTNPYFVSTEHDAFLTDWLPDRDKFLAELLRLDGLCGFSNEQCPTCPNVLRTRPSLRCRDCGKGELVCERCCVTMHERHPFHQIMRWNGQYFEKTTLQALGFVLQLGHPIGRYCPSPQIGPRDFAVVHTNGIHPITVYYCGCSQRHRAGDHVEQLLRHSLYPATTTEPTTCFTHRLLDQFCILTCQSKLTAYDYIIALQLLTDMNGVGPGSNRFKAFLRVVREWRHLKMLKRAGRGHEPGGTGATKPGELATQCPACPRPGFNLPDNWYTASADIRYIYTMFIGIDANFRLKRRAVSSDARDPALGSGWGYFVESTAYRAHILKYADQNDISTCTGFAALLSANTKFSRGYATTGVGAAICARHGFFLPNGIGDLQKGERYCNMDYIVASALSLIEERPLLLLSYDIMCQWIQNLLERISAFPPHLRIELPQGDVRYAIPKYHFGAHREKDHNQYSLNLMAGVGRSDGEEPERGWARHDGIASSTREMGPGSRHDTLEFHIESSNYTKYVGLGRALFQQYVRSRRESRAQDLIFDNFCQQLSAENVAEWTVLAANYDRNPVGPDPYYLGTSGMTEAEIHLQLAEEDEQAAEDGERTLHEITPAAMVIELLDIEDQQRKFRLKYPRIAERTASQSAEVTSKRTAILRRINAARTVQAIYMPCVPWMVAAHQLERRQPTTPDMTHTTAREDNDSPEHQPLFMPSQLSVEELDQCLPGLAEIEERLREAQMHESLDKLRVQLHVKTRLVKHKQRNVRHQRPNTRARRKLDTNEAKIIVLAEKYRAARRAKFALTGPGEWEKEWKELKREDVRTLAAEDDPSNAALQETRKRTRQHVSEGRRKTSWIWMRADAEGDEAGSLRGMQDALRVEFLRARSRCLRYRENITIIIEEQRRTLVSLEATALTWEQRAAQRPPTDAAQDEGARAYAIKQASIQRLLANKFRTLWATQDEARASSSGRTDGSDSESDTESEDEVLHLAGDEEPPYDE